MKKSMVELELTLMAKIEDIITFFTYPFTHSHWVYETKIYPRKVEHHWCKFYDWVSKTEKEGWYVLDKHGNIIPWVHFDNDSGLICLYPSMITPIEKEEKK